MIATTQAVRAAVPPADMLAAISRALHGNDGWLKPLAADIGVSERTLRAWLTGRDAQAAEALTAWIDANAGADHAADT